ncbi:MAG: M56 family metallopeptidase [Oscillospiraceae bacterium]|nr:M56 family metallopeptidase [Oscillospiraceae bacterium]
MVDFYTYFIGEDHFFDALIEASVSAVPLLILILLVKRLTRNRLDPNWRYAVWLVLILRLFIPINILLPTENHLLIPWIDMPIEIYHPEPEKIYGASEVWHWSTVSEFEAFQISEVLIPVYFTVAALYLIILFGGHFLLMRKIKRWSRPCPESFDDIISEMKVKKPSILICDAVISPMLIGFFKPRIVLPNAELTREEKEYIIRHELVHLKRGDLWYRLALNLLKVFQWFNPFVHIIAKQAAEDMEISCDKAALKGLKNADGDYSKLIVRFAARQKNTALTTSWSGNIKALKRRVSEILNSKSKNSFVLGSVMCMLAVLISGLFTSQDCTNKYFYDLVSPYPEEVWEFTADESWKNIITDETDPNKLAELAFEQYISRFVGNDVPEYFRISEYKVFKSSGRRLHGQIKNAVICSVHYGVSFYNKNGNTYHNDNFSLEGFGRGINIMSTMNIALTPVENGYKISSCGLNGMAFGGGLRLTDTEERFTYEIKEMYAAGYLSENGPLNINKSDELFKAYPEKTEPVTPEIVFDSHYSDFSENKVYRTYLVYNSPEKVYADEKLTVEITIFPDNDLYTRYSYTQVTVEKGKFTHECTQTDSLTSCAVPVEINSPEEYLEYFSTPRDGYAFTVVDYKNITEENGGVYAEVDYKGTIDGVMSFDSEYVKIRLYDI